MTRAEYANFARSARQGEVFLTNSDRRFSSGWHTLRADPAAYDNSGCPIPEYRAFFVQETEIRRRLGELELDGQARHAASIRDLLTRAGIAE